ncbi:helicase-like transcription factor CHR28 isoform X2 [Rhododendron vialii]|uniref:helicase-like transcription factor CHR28 isoform X2 n=1 Tax=Rhododendron vialii TaxID=182163 RepID=UPI00265DEB7D|nr:helicase-like transcription factor CHR28 isoform X2 [Rhododendron vialii]
MLMADERSDLWNFEDLTAGTDFGGFDINCLLDLMDDRPDPVQNHSEDMLVVKQQQGMPASIFGNNEQHSQLQTVYPATSTFGAEFAGSGTFSTSYNSEVLDYRAGVSGGSFESVGNFVSYDCGKQNASGQTGSLMDSWPVSLPDAGRILPVPDGSHCPLLEKSDVNYAYCVPAENSFQTFGRPEIMESCMMDMNRPVPWIDSFDFQFMFDNNETVSYMKDEREDLSSKIAEKYGAIMSEAQVGSDGGAVLGAPMTGGNRVSGFSSNCKENNIRSPTRGHSFMKTNCKPIIDMMLSPALPCTPSYAPRKKQVTIKDETTNELVASRRMPTQLLPPNLPSNSKRKLLVHSKDEKEDMNFASERAFPVAGDHGIDGQVSEQSCSQPSTPIKMQLGNLGCTKVENGSKLIQPKSLGTHLSKVSCQTICSNARVSSHGEDGSDVCIILDRFEPSPTEMCPVNRKSLVSLQHSTYTEPINHVAAAGVKLRANDERLIYRVALQDLSQPKTEATPPDGVLAVPLLRHQRIALAWMVKKETASLHCSGGILADDQGLGKTISTIALILKERAPSSKACPDNLKPNEMEPLNLDEDDGCVPHLDRSKQDVESCGVVSNGASLNHRDTSVQAKGRPAAGTLVVCPTSVLRQWADELHNKVTRKANLSVLVYHGSNRTKDPFELAKYDVVLTTYAIVSTEVPKQPLVDKDDVVHPTGLSSSNKRKYPPSSNKKSLKGKKKGMDDALLESAARPLARVGWFRVVLDEAQSIKNHRTQAARACWGLRAKRRWCLSGTPIQNAVDDLYSYFRFLRYDPYAVYKLFCSTIKFQINRNPTKGYKKLQAVLKTIMLRRTKGTLLDGEPIINLPPKSVELRKVDFTKEERDFYCRLEADSRAQFAEYAAAGTVKQNYVNILLMLLRLRQACDHPLLVRGYKSSSTWKSSVEVAKKLPQEKQVCLLKCLEDSLAICGICNDPPEDAVVTSCGHVFCNQCVCEHISGDDNQCPTRNCKARLGLSSVFSSATLKCSLSEQSGQDSIPDCFSSQASDKLEPFQWSPFHSSKIKAALEVLQTLSKPSLSLPSLSSENSDPLSSGLERYLLDNRNSDLDNGLNESLKVAGEKAIVFSQWTRMLDLLETCLKDSSIQYRRLDGTMTVAARDKAVKDFNTLPEVSVMIMSLKAASLGLNMVAACRVLLLDLWWNPTTEDQAVDRAHRIGQTRPVTVLRLTVKDTVEDRILALQVLY